MAGDILSKIIDRLFAIKKTNFYLIAILITAFILRLIAGINLTVGADDMHHTLHAINFFSSGKLYKCLRLVIEFRINLLPLSFLLIKYVIIYGSSKKAKEKIFSAVTSMAKGKNP